VCAFLWLVLPGKLRADINLGADSWPLINCGKLASISCAQTEPTQSPPPAQLWPVAAASQRGGRHSSQSGREPQAQPEALSPGANQIRRSKVRPRGKRLPLMHVSADGGAKKAFRLAQPDSVRFRRQTCDCAPQLPGVDFFKLSDVWPPFSCLPFRAASCALANSSQRGAN